MQLDLLGASDLDDTSTPLLAVPVADDGLPPELGLSPELDTALRERVHPEDVRAGGGRSVTVYPGRSQGPVRVVLLGMERPGEVPSAGEAIRRYAGRAIRAAEALRLEEVSILLPAMEDLDAGAGSQALAEGALLAGWRFTELKTEVGRTEGTALGDSKPPARVDRVVAVVPGEVDVEEARAGLEVGEAVARGQNLARTLQARPGNVATPSHLAAEASRMAGLLGMDVRIFGLDELRSQEMHAILAVAQGSEQEPRLIVLEHRGGEEGDPPLVLVGKGLTFDAGGISLKPPKGMEDMKFDMSAGAAVLGAMHAVAELGVPLNVVGIVPSSENLVSGKALKPGDVIHTRSGKTVEVINTDAEGRLILSDALDWARELEPAAVVDCATLTGAVVVGLGHHAAAVLGTDDELVEEVRRAGERSGERCWPLPLWPEYRSQLESEVADVKNVGGRPAGTITAAAFLREFVGDVPWAHLDVAGTAYGSEPLPYQRSGGFGFPTRLLVEWVRSRASR
jgi:leucyl aminopeptidase